MYKIKFIPFLFLLISCTGRTSNKIDTTEISNVIDLDAGLKNVQTVRLSEIADSVTFLPLETNRGSLLRSSTDGYRFSPSYIFWYNAYFDWTGKYGGFIGRRGNGPLEEPQGAYNVVFVDSCFYSIASKLIEYDKTGTPTRKVKPLKGFKIVALVNNNFAIYDFPTTLYFVNRDFETLASKNILEFHDSLQPINNETSGRQYFTYYQDHVLFYNFVNDTIFYVENNYLDPKWVVHFDDPLSYPDKKILYSDYNRLTGEAVRARIQGNYENSEWAQMTDNKHKVIAVYETESFLFVFLKEVIGFAVGRGIQPPEPYIVYYEKNTGNTAKVKGEGFVDDLLGFNNSFFPTLGIYDDNLISSIWPYELLAYINESKAKGREINPQLLALSKQVKEDDNPILIFVHLKRKL